MSLCLADKGNSWIWLIYDSNFVLNVESLATPVIKHDTFSKKQNHFLPESSVPKLIVTAGILTQISIMRMAFTMLPSPVSYSGSP